MIQKKAIRTTTGRQSQGFTWFFTKMGHVILNARQALLGIVFMLMGFGLQPVSATNHKIVVLADPHVMAPSLLNKETEDFAAWNDFLGGNRKLIDYSQALFDQAVANIKAMNPRPELVLIVGDLTKDGEKDSHEYVEGKLVDLQKAGIPTLVIPGNHDWGSNSQAVYYNGGATSPVPTCVRLGSGDNSLEKIYAAYGFGSADRESSTLTYACEPISGLVVIGIDSGTNGELSSTTLNWVCEKAQTACKAGKQVIAMMHHPLIPHITGGDSFVESSHVLYPSAEDGYETVRNRLADAGISVIFTGHFHTSDIAKDWNGDKSRTIYDVTTGSLCSYPCDYRIVTLNESMNSMSITTESITSAGPSLTGDAFSTKIAKTRLSSSMEKIIQENLTNTAGGIASSVASSLLAEAYICHAEGNENQSKDAASILSKLQVSLMMAKVFSKITDVQYQLYLAMANSVLKDISNYDSTDGRADQTNDRTLVFSMPNVFSPNDGDNTAVLSATKNEDGKGKEGYFYSIDGHRFSGGIPAATSIRGIVVGRNGKKIRH